jgi:16S rRNA (guanine527-N7)-methyltransferase
MPLLAPGGCLLAMKGEQAAAEVDEHRAELRRRGLGVSIVGCGREELDTPVTVVVVRRDRARRERLS